MRHIGSAVVTLLLVAVACGAPPSSVLPPPPPGAGPVPPPPPVRDTIVARLVVEAPNALLVHEAAMLSFTGYNARGQVVAMGRRLHIDNDDPTVLDFSPLNVATALRCGIASISLRVDTVRLRVMMPVRARVKLLPERAWNLERYDAWQMLTGDTLPLMVRYADVDGELLSELPVVTWSSSDSASATVSPSGLVTTHRGGAPSITATTPDGADSTQIHVEPEQAGGMALIRYTHAIRGLGPITFTPSKGDPVTLNYGESVRRPVPTGLLQVTTEGMPLGRPEYTIYRNYAATIRRDDELSFYAVGDREMGFLTPTWYRQQLEISPDVALVRLVQSTGLFGVVGFSESATQVVDGYSTLYYFDPLDVSPFFSLAGGTFALILETKYGASDTVRIPVMAQSGHATTMVFTGTNAADYGVLTIIDQ